MASGLSVSPRGLDAAVAQWGPGGQGLSTQVEWGSTGFFPGSGQQAGATSVNGSVDQVILTGLTTQTTYDVYIRDSCAFDDHSPWVGPVRFTTGCVPLVAPFTESFDGAAWQPGPVSSEADSISSGSYRGPGAADGTYKWGVYHTSTGSVNTGPAAVFFGHRKSDLYRSLRLASWVARP
ncbi:MAG: hypothetical protein U5L96_03115 [Owenweeksia sp.]|nr:hypothetical protein [Owenweeksia sp.]